MKAYIGCKQIALLILNISIRQWWVVSITSYPL